MPELKIEIPPDYIGTRWADWLEASIKYLNIKEGKVDYKEIVITDPDREEETEEIPVKDMILSCDGFVTVNRPNEIIIEYGSKDYLAYELDSQYHWKIGVYGNKLIAVPLKK